MVVQDKNKKEDIKILAVVYVSQNKGSDQSSNKDLFGIIAVENTGKKIWFNFCNEKGDIIGKMWFAESNSSVLTKDFEKLLHLEVKDNKGEIIVSLNSSPLDTFIRSVTHTSIIAIKLVSESEALALGFSQKAIDKCLA